MEIDEISIEAASSMITDSITTIVVECPHLPQGVGRTCLDNMKTDALTVLGEVFQSTPGSQALMQNPFSFRVWSTGTEPTKKFETEMYPPAAEYTSQDRSASVEPSEPR